MSPVQSALPKPVNTLKKEQQERAERRFEGEMTYQALTNPHFVATPHTHQSLQVLALLLAHPGEPVTCDELRNQLWPADTFLDFDHSINAAIKQVATTSRLPQIA